MFAAIESSTNLDMLHEISKDIELHFPATDTNVSQDEEYCTISLDGVKKDIRLHDYHNVFSIPGLYERIFHEHLQCRSPEVVCLLLQDEIEKHNTDISQVTVLEIGAGNGMVGERLQQSGIHKIIGVDILIEAKLAAHRDRPKVYDNYFVIDLTDVPVEIEREIRHEQLNGLVSVAALGFNDLPPLAYAKAYNMIQNNGWIAFNIKDKFLGQKDNSGFARLIERMIDEKVLTIVSQKRYQHRLSIDRMPLYYDAIVGRKEQDIPTVWLEELN